MSEVDTTVADTTGAETDLETPVEQTLAEHEQTYGKNGNQAKQPESVADPVTEPEKKAHPSVEQRRGDDGTFVEGKKRTPRGKDAVARIDQLTGRAKTAEERVAALEKEVLSLKRSHASPSVIATAEAKVDAADPEPKEDDAAFGGDYLKYLGAVSRWNTRQEIRETRARDAETQTKSRREAADRELLSSWVTRTEAAKTKYTDFEAVAFGPTKIKVGSTIDAWIMEHKAGPDVLYFLQSHPDELDTLSEMSVIEQLDSLSLLGQRFVSQGSESAGVTRSAAGPKVAQPPRPPNLVRTAAQRAPNAPPTGEMSLAEHEKHYGKRR